MIDDLVNRAVLDDLLLLLEEYPKPEAQPAGVAVAPRPLLPPIVEEQPALQPHVFADGPDEVAALQQAYQDDIDRFLDLATSIPQDDT